MPVNPDYHPERLLLELGEGFYDLVQPADFPRRIVRYRNDRAAARIGLDALTDEEWRDHFARFTPLPGALPEPLSLRYHGYQFRVYNPELGDGRGFTFAQMREVGTNRLLELGTKGSGQTPWSRQGDGRLTLKGGVREVLATEMLEALGVNTSKTLSVIETGEELWRGDEPSPTRSCVLVRLSHGHIRIGSFERHAFHQDADRLRRLVDYAAAHLIWEAAAANDRPLALFRAVMKRVAALGAQWMAAGFVHGVLNTDNINITGESFDYGPWRFLPTLDPNFTAAYFDQTGLYAFGRQLETLQWNLCRFAEALLAIADREALIAALQEFPALVDEALRDSYLRRLGLARRTTEEDDNLLRAFNHFLADSQAPYEQAFFDFYGGGERWRASPSLAFYQGPAFENFIGKYETYAAADPTRRQNAYFQRSQPVTMLIDEVEAIWAAIAERDDWSLFHAKLADIAVMREALLPSP
ncbi:MAG: YdiU family protein [Proteobacteria bacterium]|nr:MAG: YdiU family protein [Pseudomonadota bacterium]